MTLRAPALVALALAAPLIGCAGSYPARPSPRLELVSDSAVARNGQVYPLGSWGGGLIEAVRGNPAAEQEAHSYESEQTAAGVVGYLADAAWIASIGIATYSVSNPQTDSQSAQNLTYASFGVFAGGTLLQLISAATRADARQHLYNAIHLYNDALPPDGGSFRQGPPGYPGYPGGPQPPYGAPPQPFPPGSKAPAPRPLVPWATPDSLATTR